jgi:hypothetical protein
VQAPPPAAARHATRAMAVSFSRAYAYMDIRRS